MKQLKWLLLVAVVAALVACSDTVDNKQAISEMRGTDRPIQVQIHACDSHGGPVSYSRSTYEHGVGWVPGHAVCWDRTAWEWK